MCLRRPLVRIGCGLLLYAAAVASLAQQAPVSKPAILVELFTSEGCSSCPPADALLKQMNGKYASSGQLVIALSEHVTYWNHDGWVDPFSQEIFTGRQNAYGQRFHLDDVYTPQLVVNGEKQVSGSDGQAILKTFAEEPPSPAADIKIQSATRDGKSVSVTFSIHGAIPAQGADLYLAVAENEVSSSVSRGENHGRTLTHVAVVRSLVKVATIKSETATTVKVPAGSLPEGKPAHVVLFAQTAGLGRVLGVVAQPL